MEKILKQFFGFDSFRKGQQEIIQTVLSKQDTLAVMPTGGGKSLCYQLPALLFDGLTVVVSPLISLMQDQVTALHKMGIEALFLNSSLDWDTYRANMAQVQAGIIKLLYCAPETLLTDRLQNLLADIQVDCITVDEAHCVSEWGHDFRPDYRAIASLRNMFPDAVFLALTATATEQVRSDIKKILHLKKCAEFISSFNRENIFLEVVPKRKVKEGGPELQVLEFLASRKNQSGIIFCFSRKQVDLLTTFLNSRGLKALPYHAGLSDVQRTKNQAAFLNDKANIIVATVAFGMGIDKANVRFVIHFDLPKSLEQYYQEIGRAGRDGKAAHAILLYSYADTRKIRYFMDEKVAKELESAENQLGAMVKYCESFSCRRKDLLAYFNENYVSPQKADDLLNFSCCDLCAKGSGDEHDVTVFSQKLLSCILRTGERYGTSYVIDVLLGSRNMRIKENKHHTLSTWGIGKELSKQDWFELTNRLIEAGFLRKSADFGVLTLTGDAMDTLKERGKIYLTFSPSKGYTEKNKGHR